MFPLDSGPELGDEADAHLPIPSRTKTLNIEKYRIQTSRHTAPTQTLLDVCRKPHD
jgi:hypothetical protein